MLARPNAVSMMSPECRSGGKGSSKATAIAAGNFQIWPALVMKNGANPCALAAFWLVYSKIWFATLLSFPR